MPVPTVKALADENVLAAPACSVPAVMLVTPEYVLRPDSFNVPAPTLARPPAPDRTPLQVAPRPFVSIVDTPPVNVAFTLVTSADSMTLIVPPPRLN